MGLTERHRLRSLGTLVVLNGLIPIKTQPLYLLNLLASPLAFLFFITIASHGTLLSYGVGGGMVLTMLSVGTGLQSDLTHYRHDLKFQDVVVASPVEAPTYVAGMALSELVYSAPGMALFAAIWAIWGHPTVLDAAVIVVALLLVWAFATALAFMLATWFQDVRETWMFSPLISLGFSVLPPVYYPITSLPAWVQPLAYLSPTTYAASLVQQAMDLIPRSLTSSLIDLGVLLAFTAALFLLAAFRARWREA